MTINGDGKGSLPIKHEGTAVKDVDSSDIDELKNLVHNKLVITEARLQKPPKTMKRKLAKSRFRRSKISSETITIISFDDDDNIDIMEHSTSKYNVNNVIFISSDDDEIDETKESTKDNNA
ncbi:hypothetical protein L195_g019843 [Trifolium pratense]|uniref:Uncharacterized protein n=1 Tax=Trifolium pratense TaxID=57577 RepID=A0A2K3N0Q9_TRIPR|nr:hypothetical protein L195_g019843 [Trifolium pratense]